MINSIEHSSIRLQMRRQVIKECFAVIDDRLREQVCDLAFKLTLHNQKAIEEFHTIKQSIQRSLAEVIP